VLFLEHVLVGARFHTTSGHTNGGRAYIYLGGAAGYSPTPSWQFETLVDQAQVGYSVAWAGDVNRDGFDDWMVGAPYNSGGESNEGAVYLFYGGSGALSTVPVWTQESNHVEAYFGYAVAGGGDINGDGYPDLVVGAPGDENPLTKSPNEGAVYMFAGSAGTPSHTPSKIYYGQQVDAALRPRSPASATSTATVTPTFSPVRPTIRTTSPVRASRSSTSAGRRSRCSRRPR
jgi:hypothetical protein